MQHSSRWRVEAAPLPRGWLDAAAPAARLFFGVLFLAWSWVSTVLKLHWLLAPVLPGETLGIADRLLVGIGFAFLVSLAEFISSDRWVGIYWVVLLTADAPFTAWQTRDWLVQIVDAQTDIAIAGHVGIWIIGLVSGVVAAKFGEGLLFGWEKPQSRSA